MDQDIAAESNSTSEYLTLSNYGPAKQLDWQGHKPLMVGTALFVSAVVIAIVPFYQRRVWR